MVGHQLFDFGPIPVPQVSTGKRVILHEAIEVEAESKGLETVVLREGCRKRNRPSVIECLGNASENPG